METCFQVELTQGKITRVDEDVWDSMQSVKWGVMKSTRGRYYCVRGVYDNPVTRHIKRLWLHREIMKPPADMVVDHISGDSLDNRRCNLRICTPAQNAKNQGKNSLNKSGFRGVCRAGNKWQALIAHEGKQRYLGTFSTPEEAHAAYCKASEEYHGEFARPF